MREQQLVTLQDRLSKGLRYRNFEVRIYTTFFIEDEISQEVCSYSSITWIYAEIIVPNDITVVLPNKWLDELIVHHRNLIFRIQFTKRLLCLYRNFRERNLLCALGNEDAPNMLGDTLTFWEGWEDRVVILTSLTLR
jgi:hypothetical protein